MRKKMVAISILSIMLLLALGLAVVTYAQGGDEKKEEEGGIKGLGLADPPPAGYTVLYTFTGAKDNQNAAPSTGATVVHCTNAGTASVQVRVEISDCDNTPTIYGTIALNPNMTKTFSSHNTAFYYDDVVLSATTDAIDQGSGRVLVNSSSAKVICTAQVLDPVGDPPAYAVKLTLYDGSGNIVGKTDKVFLPVIHKQ